MINKASHDFKRRSVKIQRFTRNLCLGVLMTLVLAFSVQSQQEQPAEIQVPGTVSGYPGGTETLTLIAPENAFIRIGDSDDTFPLENSSIPTQSDTIYRSTLTLPRQTGSYTLSVFIERTRHRVTVSVTTTPVQTGALRVRVDPFSGAPGTTATVTVTATDSNNQPADVRVILTATGGVLSTSSVTTGRDGTETVTLTRGGTLGNENYVVASASNYDLVSSRFLISEVPPELPSPVGEPHALAIQDGNDQKGELNTPLEAPFVVKVVDAYDNPAKGVRVRFRVTRGSGSLSPRTPLTDKNGLAETTFTPTSTGRLRAVATVPGVDGTETFYIGVQAVESVRVSVGFPSIAPKVLVNAVNRPAMLWIDGGKIYALVGADVKEEFVQGVDNAMNVSVDASGGKIYWAAQTGPSAGTINAANLDGTGATILTSILSVPMGIAVDTVNNKLYWTNSRGRIQRANLDGSGIRNVLENLPGPMDIVLSGGNAYWTQADGSVRFVNLTGQKVVRDISTGTDTLGSLAIGNGKVYWTEMTAEGGGTINGANLDGDPGATQLASILAAPSGIAVDTVRSKLYWTNSRGRVQNANLNGSGIKTVVDGLGYPGEIVVSNNITEPLAAGAPTVVGLKRNRIQEQINLQQLLATARPEKTQLLANYPNPFNPETWIPYELATDTDVRITIYDAQGVVIQMLQLGHQAAGYYTDRERAAYWDGRNAISEQVASGIYFYQLETDEMSIMRKMVILK